MTAWPPVTHETVRWVPSVATEHLTRRQRAELRDTYEATVPATIAAEEWSPPPPLAADLDDITAEISRFDATSPLELAPFAGLLLRSEAAASSRIEHLTASARAILSAEVGDRSRRNATEIAHNTTALALATDTEVVPDAAAILQMHRTLLAEVDPDAGRWRSQQVWVGGSDVGPFGAAHVAPVHERVPALIEDLTAFMGRQDLPVLTHAALAHAQFETIHPFTDGNGRTGRALVHAMLRAHRLTRRVTVPVSAGLLTDTGAYFAALDAYRQGDAGPIVERMAHAALRGTQQARVLVEELTAVHARWGEQVSARRHSTTWKVLDLLRQRPVLTAEVLRTELGIGPTHVRRAVDPLLEAGILKETRMTGDARRVVWRAPEVLQALDRFAERSGRRVLGNT
ncbi:Fic family protein [Kytococcus sp. Marseille-QA3725]